MVIFRVKGKDFEFKSCLKKFLHSKDLRQTFHLKIFIFHFEMFLHSIIGVCPKTQDNHAIHEDFDKI
ncbi:hypothetical protein LEP1GSC188_3642 [Leptospira weilii serovar Topaz str. LT2116]|uniref:Uncharacterized protein n=1 Tax=Leptospira weilii serovar Topaz str. LT2116 TaxID=1088540 RepID=M3GVD3_9LEPT|nr:hypothetical protein LEP1GSC188_3642 [Leptospira weilii serovar Topaz str. LT2116]